MANTLKFGNGEWYGKKDTILAYNDENSNYKPLPFDFSRASSATVVNKAGLIETVGSGEPRIDFKDDAKGALKLEPQRTNLLIQSNQFDTTWINSNTTGTSGYLGLDGTNSAWLLTKTASSNANIRQNITFSGTHTFSVYLKKGTLTSVALRSTGGLDARVQINLIDGTTSGELNTTSVKAESVGNDWWRCSLTFEAASNTAVRIYPDSITGTTAGNIYIYGASLESGSYATSYIPTSGSAVTRVADACSQTPPDGVIGQTEGTVYAEVNVASIESVGVFSGWKVDGTSGNQLAFIMYPNGRIQALIFDGGSIVVNINDFNYGLTSGVHKIAFAYKQNDSILYVDGSVVGSNTSATIPIVNDFYINYSNGGSLNYNETKLYNTRLTDSELQQLTTI